MTEEEMLKKFAQVLAPAEQQQAVAPPPPPMPLGEQARKLIDEYIIYHKHMHPWGALKTLGGFEVGQLITPRPGTFISDAGIPYIVLNVRCPDPDFDGAWHGTMRDGMLLDIRVGRWARQAGMVCIWLESWPFEPYTGEIA